MGCGSRWGGVALALLAVAGCGGGSQGQSPPPPPPPSPDVTGTIIDTWWQGDGSTIARPRVPAGMAISAYLPQAGGGYRILHGTISADGHFSIPGVGFDTYFLAKEEPGIGLSLYEEQAHHIDLGADKTGRPDSTVATTQTLLAFQLTGLQSWTASDSLELSSSSAHLRTTRYGDYFALGTTGGTVSFDLMSWPLPVAGDLGWIVQRSVVTPTPGGPSHEVASRCATLQAMEAMSDGDAVTVGPMPLSPPVASGTVSLDVRGSEFAALAPILGASSVTPDPTAVSVFASPPGPAAGYPLGLLRVSSGTPSGDVDFGTLSFPRFQPSTFVEWRSVLSSFVVRFPTLQRPQQWWYYVATEPVTGADPVVRPTLGPPREPRIGGLDLAQPQAGVGLTPTLTWSPPALGSPDAYSVTINDVTDYTWKSVLNVMTPQTQFEIPAGILQAGRTYLVAIWSNTRTSYDPAAPARASSRSVRVPTVSEPFTP